MVKRSLPHLNNVFTLPCETCLENLGATVEVEKFLKFLHVTTQL